MYYGNKQKEICPGRKIVMTVLQVSLKGQWGSKTVLQQGSNLIVRILDIRNHCTWLESAWLQQLRIFYLSLTR